jgi:integrase
LHTAKRRVVVGEQVVDTATGDIHTQIRRHHGRAEHQLPITVLRPCRREGGVAWTKPAQTRHTAASLAVAAGANVKAVQQMLGHASAAMTLLVYAGLL